MTEVIDGVIVADDELPQQDLVPYAPATPANLFGAQSPREVVAQAAEYADALKDVIQQRQLFKRIGDKNHVLVEGWTLLGSMLGVFPVLESAEPVEGGWRATVAAQTRDGSVVGRATALCLRSENQWKNRDEYALLSMAQTRATSKCLRAPLGFIIQLAGFNPTPESEIPEAAPAATPPTASARPAAEAQGTPAADKATTAQHRKYRAILAELERDFPRSDGLKWDELSAAWMRREFQVESHTELSKAQMSTLIERTNEHLEGARVPFGDPADERAVAEEVDAAA